MNNNKSNYLPRTKSLIAGILAMTCALSAQAVDKIKVGLLLPYSGTYAVTGESTTNGLNLALEESGGKFGGLDVEFVAADRSHVIPAFRLLLPMRASTLLPAHCAHLTSYVRPLLPGRQLSLWVRWHTNVASKI